MRGLSVKKGLLIWIFLLAAFFANIAPASAAYTFCCLGENNDSGDSDYGKVVDCKQLTSEKAPEPKKDCEQFNTDPGINYHLLGSCSQYPQCPPETKEAVKEAPIKLPDLTLQVPIGDLEKFSEATPEGATDTGQIVSVPWLSQYFSALYKYLIGIAGILAAAMLIFGGLKWMLAAGNAAKIGEAKESIGSAVIGLLLALFSYLLLWTINPQLVNLGGLNIEYIKNIPLETAHISDSGVSISIPTGSLSEKAFSVAEQIGLSEPCALYSIFAKESGGKAGAIGYDANYQGSSYVSSRVLFLMSGKKYSGATFTPPFTSIKTYKQNPSKWNKTKIFNDDKFDINKAPDYGLDWRFSVGFGLGQMTLAKDGYKNGIPWENRKDPPSSASQIPKLLTAEYAMERSAKLFSSNMACAAKKGYSGEMQVRAAFYAYAAGCGAMNKVKDTETFMTHTASARAMKYYSACKENNP